MLVLKEKNPGTGVWCALFSEQSFIPPDCEFPLPEQKARRFPPTNPPSGFSPQKEIPRHRVGGSELGWITVRAAFGASSLGRAGDVCFKATRPRVAWGGCKDQLWC